MLAFSLDCTRRCRFLYKKMGSSISRHLRDLADVGGFEASNGPVSSPAAVRRSSAHTEVDSCPSTPTANTLVCRIDVDPRSPTAEIVRTPIEVFSKYSRKFSEDSPSVNVMQSRRSYLETDLDTLSTNESAQKPEAVEEEGRQLLPGLSSAHLMKLRFLGIDPRSPSTDVVRTPIQLGKGHQRDASPIHFDDTLSVGSVSSQDIFSNSFCSSEFTRGDCSDPSAFISETEDLSDKEDDECVATASKLSSQEAASEATDDDLGDVAVQFNSPMKDKIALKTEDLPKIVNKLLVFQEDEHTNEVGDKTPTTPDSIKKPTGNRARTPLTPICNRNRTPNSILRAKQTQTIEKEILTKAKIYSMDENKLTPSKISSNKKENVLVSRSNRNNENIGTKKKVLAHWDQDNSVII